MIKRILALSVAVPMFMVLSVAPVLAKGTTVRKPVTTVKASVKPTTQKVVPVVKPKPKTKSPSKVK